MKNKRILWLLPLLIGCGSEPTKTTELDASAKSQVKYISVDYANMGGLTSRFFLTTETGQVLVDTLLAPNNTGILIPQLPVPRTTQKLLWRAIIFSPNPILFDGDSPVGDINISSTY